MVLFVQIISGIFLTWIYSPSIFHAFSRIEIIERLLYEVSIIRVFHVNGVNFFFLFIYLHIIRGIIINSFIKNVSVWVSGFLIYIILIAIAFLGYTLPWGQISLWGSTVITNLLSVIPYFGPNLVIWIWEGFSIQEFTLKLFFSVHFFLPFVLLVFLIIHLIRLHEAEGSSSGVITKTTNFFIYFRPFLIIKDLITIIILFFLIIFINKNSLLDAENWLPANEIISPIHIKPEWYLLYLYAVLRSIPNKALGFLALVLALLRIGFLIFRSFNLNLFFYKFFHLIIIVFWLNFLILTWIGGIPVEYPYFFIGKWTTFLYFILINFFWVFKFSFLKIFN